MTSDFPDTPEGCAVKGGAAQDSLARTALRASLQGDTQDGVQGGTRASTQSPGAAPMAPRTAEEAQSDRARSETAAMGVAAAAPTGLEARGTGPATGEPDAADLAALVGSRLCHDLISPLGAIGNGLELLQMVASTSGPEMALIAQSVAAANARVRFFRLAFGHAGRTERIGQAELRRVCDDFGAGGRVAFDWRAAGDHPRPVLKLACLALLCIEQALPRGGTIRVDCAAPGAAGDWRISGTGPAVHCDGALWSWLSASGADTAAALNPAQVQFALLAQEARRQGRRPAGSWSGNRVEIGF